MSLNEVKVIKKSRKSHNCVQCWLEIPKGSSYKIHYGVFDGSFFNNKMHKECMRLWEVENENSDHDNWFNLDDCLSYSDNLSFEQHQNTIRKIYKLSTPESER